MGFKRFLRSYSSPPLIMKDVIKPASSLKASDLILFTLIPVNAVVFVATVFLNFLAGQPEFSNGLFINGITNVSRLFPVEITPSGPTFAIWSVIYLAELLIVVYGVSLMLRLTRGGLAYANPPVLNRPFYTAHIVTNLLNITWLFVWDRLQTTVSAGVLATLTIFLIWATGMVARRQQSYRQELLDANRTFDIGMLNTVVLNGLGIYAGWTAVATHVNLAITLTYDANVDNELASLIAFGLLIAEYIIYTALDVFLLGKLTRAFLTPYAVILWAAVGVTANNFDSTRLTSIVALIFSIFSFFVLLFKVTLLFFVPRFRPGKGYGMKKIDDKKILGL